MHQRRLHAMGAGGGVDDGGVATGVVDRGHPGGGTTSRAHHGQAGVGVAFFFPQELEALVTVRHVGEVHHAALVLVRVDVGEGGGAGQQGQHSENH
jgi:hypothetical protein